MHICCMYYPMGLGWGSEWSVFTGTGLNPLPGDSSSLLPSQRQPPIDPSLQMLTSAGFQLNWPWHQIWIRPSYVTLMWKKKLLSTWPRDEVGWEVNLMPKRCLASITHIYFLGQTKRETLAFVENGLVSFRCKPRQSSTRWGTIFLPNFWQEILTKSKV